MSGRVFRRARCAALAFVGLVLIREQVQDISQVSQGLGQIDAVTQSNTASPELTASSAQELSAQATRVQELVQRFRLS